MPLRRDRTPAPGELYRYHLDRLAWMDELVAGHGVRRALNAADLEAAHEAGGAAARCSKSASTDFYVTP